MATTEITNTFMECDHNTMIEQIGMMNIMAVSGGRGTKRPTGMTFPINYGYCVEVDYAANDTYTVQRVRYAKGKRWVKGLVENVYCDELGEMVYRASCYKNVEFGEGR